MDVLLLRLDAPLMSFGGEAVDAEGVTREFPGRAMLAGLVGNALGYDHREFERLQSLQGRLRYAVRQDRAGERVVDFQTIDLGQPCMAAGWTTRGYPEERGGDRDKDPRKQTHLRWRHFLAGASYTVALSLAGEGEPSLDDVERALRAPERPLFIGRKCCLPATPMVLGRVAAATLRGALSLAPSPKNASPGPRKAWWPVDEGTDVGRTLALVDDMDWANQVHTGRRFMQEGIVTTEARDG